MSDQAKTRFPWVKAGSGVARRVLAHSPEAMTVEVAFDKGAIGAAHSHPHVQTTYVRSGSFLFTVDGVERRLEAGDSVVIPSGTEHGCTALDAGTLIDSFSPRREDFL